MNWTVSCQKPANLIDTASRRWPRIAMPAATDVLLTLKQARDRRMAKVKLIEVIVAREGIAHRESTTAAVEKMIDFHIGKGRIVSETKNGVEFLTAVR